LRSASKRPGRDGAAPRPAFALPLHLAAGLVRWDGIALRPVSLKTRRHRRSAHRFRL